MKALILAAGQGKRIRAATDRPKCLLKIGGISLLERYLRALEGQRIGEVVVVVGYMKEEVIDAAERIPFQGRVRFVSNRDYVKGSILSLWAARGELDTGTDILLMDGDVYFEEEVLVRLLTSKADNCLIIDTTSPNLGEEFMVGVKEGVVVTMRRGLKGDFDILGEWVGFVKLARSSQRNLVKAMEEVVESGSLDIGYEDILNKIVRDAGCSYVLADGLRWVEIDFPEDVDKARFLEENR